MKQSRFEQLHQRQWQSFAQQLQSLKGHQVDLSDFAANYRRICQHLALAEARGYSSQLVAHLQQLATAGHRAFYRRKSHFLARLIGFVVADFPRLVRQQWRLVVLSALLLYGSLALCALLFYRYPELIHKLLDTSGIREMEDMYNPALRHLGPFAHRGSAIDWTMFGFYIMNNIGIAFQMFAGGLVLGLGTILYLLYNGMQIGAAAGHLSVIGYGQNFWSFAVGHSAFELNAIVIAGASGLRLGLSLLMPGQLPRGQALRQGAQTAVALVCGAALMLVVAAFIESFWSSFRLINPTIKYGVAVLLWLLVGAWLLLAGRNHAAA